MASYQSSAILSHSPPRPMSNFRRGQEDYYNQSPYPMTPSSQYKIRRPSAPISIPEGKQSRSSSSTSSSSISPISSSAICSKCGLRRKPSDISIVEAGGCSPSHYGNYFPRARSKSGFSHHCLTDECCGDWCPDTIMPRVRTRPRSNTNSSLNSCSSAGDVGGGGGVFEDRKRHHHRRRSSLCHGSSVIDEDDDMKTRCDEDLMVDRTVGAREAEKIARNVIQRSSRRTSLAAPPLSPLRA